MPGLVRYCLSQVELGAGRARDQHAEAAGFEKKTVLTFLSQGALGGTVGYFLVIVCVAASHPNGWNFLYLIALPMLLVFGAALGSFSAIFVWLAERLRKRRLKFAARAMIVSGVVTILSVALSYLTKETPPNEQSPRLWLAGCFCLMVLPIVLMTGSAIRPGHLMFLGAGPRSARHNFGSWLSLPVGFLLRVASIFGLFEGLMTLALWLSARTVDWLEFPAREHLPAIILAVLYFATSTYFSISRPRRFFLLPTAIILNLPLAALIVHLRLLARPDTDFLSYLLLAFICLWAVYTLSRMIAPGAAPRVVLSRRETAVARGVAPSGACQVQL